MKQKNILQQAIDIVYGKTQREIRKYGPFDENMKRTAQIVSILTKKDISAEDVFLMMIVQKLIRESYSHKEDNFIDAAGYLSGLFDLKNKQPNDHPITLQSQPNGSHGRNGSTLRTKNRRMPVHTSKRNSNRKVSRTTRKK